jgi:hypothetical protein
MKWNFTNRLAKLDKYIYSLFAFVLLSVLFSQMKSDFGTVSDVAMVIIALANLIFVVRAFNVDRQKKAKHIFPTQIKERMIAAIDNSIVFINYNTLMRSKVAAGATVEVVAQDGAIANMQFMHNEEQWIWDNRALESQKLLQLSEAIDSYFMEEKKDRIGSH